MYEHFSVSVVISTLCYVTWGLLLIDPLQSRPFQVLQQQVATKSIQLLGISIQVMQGRTLAKARTGFTWFGHSRVQIQLSGGEINKLRTPPGLVSRLEYHLKMKRWGQKHDQWAPSEWKERRRYFCIPWEHEILIWLFLLPIRLLLDNEGRAKFWGFAQL